MNFIQMTSYNIKKVEKDLVIDIKDISSNKDEILANFNDCKEGKCSCPTDEYKKLKDMKINFTDNEIEITIAPKENTEFNKKEIGKCLDFSINNKSK